MEARLCEEADTATVWTQILRGYQWVGDRPETLRRVVLACVAHSLPLSDGTASHASGPGRDLAGRMIRKKGLPPDLIPGARPAFRTGHARMMIVAEGNTREWLMLSSSAPNGATKGRARSSTGCRNRPTSLSASRAATMPGTPSSSMAKPTSWRYCPPACCDLPSLR